MYMAAHELDVGDFGPAAFGTIGGEVFVVEGVAGGAREVAGSTAGGGGGGWMAAWREWTVCCWRM